VEFLLRYRGPLPGNKSDPDDKQRVRMALSPQLRELCKRDEFFADCLYPDLLRGQLVGGKLEFNHDVNHPANDKQFCRVPMSGFEFVPLIHRQNYLACALDITWLRREKPGDIIKGGDIDNKLKTLFDGMRMPLEEKEVGNQKPSETNERVFCLLDDDSLIFKLSVATFQMLEPEPLGPRDTDCDLLIHVTASATRRTWGNIGV
jgi:hypothetical protein